MATAASKLSKTSLRNLALAARLGTHVMATRYSGTLILTITYRDRTEDYHVRITEQNADLAPTVLNGLRLAPAWPEPVDSARTYDEVARSAISFASADDEVVGNYAMLDPEGDYLIQRRNPARAR